MGFSNGDSKVKAGQLHSFWSVFILLPIRQLQSIKDICELRQCVAPTPETLLVFRVRFFSGMHAAVFDVRDGYW